MVLGTKVGDPEEILAMDEVFCTPNRKKPLFVGSIKSNLGHTEPASGMCSLVKVLLGMENSCILPNINYDRPREGADALEKGRMVVVTDVTPWPKDGTGFAAINSFGFGGANCHVVLKRFFKEKIDQGLPRDDLPRLISLSGRVEDAIPFMLEDITKRPLDVEFVRILHQCFGNTIPGHPYRGYTIMSKTGELSRSCKWHDGQSKPACFVFGGASEEWLKIGKHLFAIPLFAATIQRIQNILAPKGFNVTEVINKGAATTTENVIMGNIAIQIALVDILKTLELAPDHIIGYSIGELVAAYVDNALTLEQTVLCAFYIAQSLRGINKDNVVSYEVELTKEEIQSILPNDVEIISHNSNKNHTIAGPTQKVEQLVNDLKKKDVTVKKNLNHYGLHSKHLEKIRSKLSQHLKELIPKPKPRSSKWITTGSAKNQDASAEYFVNNLLSPIFFNEAIPLVPSESVLVEIGPKALDLQNFTKVTLIYETDEDENYVYLLLIGLGRLHELGYSIKLSNLYPKVQWPVSLNTPMVSPLIKWNHEEDWYVALYRGQDRMKSGERTISFSVKESDWSFVTGHVIDGRNLVPATGYLIMVWETFSMMLGILLSDMAIVFENVKFHRATNIPRGGAIELIVMVQKGTGQFEVAELGQAIVSGRIYVPEDFLEEVVALPLPPEDEETISFTTKDIYKELKLRGYNYMGAFRGLKQANLEGTKGLVEWTGNWISFMDNMLQIKLLQEDTRNLYVPTGIERLAVDARRHIRYAKQFGETPELPVYVNKETGIIKSGGIEIRGLIANSIARRKVLADPVLEKHTFVPLETELSTEESVRVNVQIFLENNYGIKHRTAELIDEATKPDAKPLGPVVRQAFSDQPLIQPEIIIFSKEPMELENITVEDKKLGSESHSCAMVIASKICSRPEILKQALGAVKENGMLLSREDLDFNPEADQEELSGVDILSIHQTDSEKLVLLRKSVEFTTHNIIEVSENKDFNWLPTLQKAVKDDEKVIVYSQNAPLSGILGFYNCLRREPGGMNIRCVYIVDEDAPKFDVEDEFYAKQLKKGLIEMIYKDGKWGTYRHLPIPKETVVQRQHVFNNVTVRGDLSSLRWIEGPLSTKIILPPEHTLVHIYYASINFRDIMTASGRINNDVITKDRIEQYNVQGFEFSGRDASGKRVLGMIPSGGLASIINADSYLVLEIPEIFSMEDAATIPVAYGTVLHAFKIANLKEGESVLIHAGSGGVGQAAIHVATFHKCTIFTTVGTQEKREFIRQTFPHIPESHIGNSRDTSFEQMVMRETNGRGVDVVLNSLAEEKLQASVRCLAPGGHFLEIGKFDLASNNNIGLNLLRDGRSFHGVMLDAYFTGDPSLKAQVADSIHKGFLNGWIKPLSRMIFKQDEVEPAFRYMAGGKHIGKVIIKLREEEADLDVLPQPQLFNGISRFYGNCEKSYIISGGLGGFGLELADWLVTRGVKKLILISRTGVKNGYQASRIRIWNSYGVDTKISTADTTTKEGCIQVIEEANRTGPVEAIFNLAVVLKDALLENQNADSFATSLAPKAVATQYLDEVSREMCPELLYFVVFSSVVCGRGNPGQTNYGMANSIMERICEKRKKDGYPALAIQWGAIGEVGLVAEMQELQTEIEIGGTLQQRVTSCLSVIDTFLKQDEPVVSSIVVAEKRGGAGGADNIVDAVKNILGLRDLKTISLHSSLSELGMDSMMAVEIKQTLEREYEVFLTAQDIRSMTFARLQEVAQEKASENEHHKKNSEDKEKMPEGVYMLFRYMGDEKLSTIPMVRLPSLIKEKSVAPKVFILPGIEGMATVLEPLAANLSSHAFCLQYTYTNQSAISIEELAMSLLPNIQENLPKTTPFTLVGYSYGTIVSMQLAALLEAEGRIGRVILIDGAPDMYKDLIKQQVPEMNSEALLQTLILCALMQLFIPIETVMKHKMDIYNCKTYEERVKLAMTHAPEDTPHSQEYQKRVCMLSYHRVKSVLEYQPKFRKLKSMVRLFKPSRHTIENYDEDYKLQQWFENPIETTTFEGNHVSILKNPQVAYTINTIIDTSSVYFKQSIMKDKAEVETLKEVGIKQI
ncbi:hypothetical protein ILUMI_01702 [Ignelater luminosus]|uniref:Fatty acid synthase n=1 Tax=Ignelater luminosus TaxID=2038154 RepID=A0A8K0DJM5_IGNLU|nr:hypothetical protein ILUMI_01702 [Ignelater luminosus]